MERGTLYQLRYLINRRNVVKKVKSDVNANETEGLASTKKTYEISKSLNFEWDFVISELISGFRVRFQIFR